MPNINQDEINAKLFLDNYGEAWRSYSPAGTGEFEWWCENVETERKKLFDTEYVKQKILTYQIDIKHFNEKNKLELNMFALIKSIADRILKNETISQDNLNQEEINILNILMQGKFDIKSELI